MRSQSQQQTRSFVVPVGTTLFLRRCRKKKITTGSLEGLDVLEPEVAPSCVCKDISGSESQSKGSGEDFNWLDPQKQLGGTVVQNSSTLTFI